MEDHGHRRRRLPVRRLPPAQRQVPAARWPGMLGFSDEQIKPGLLCPVIGNTYAGASLIGLTAILDIAKPGDRILMVSFGSGAGSDAFVIRVTDAIENGATWRSQTAAITSPAARRSITPPTPAIRGKINLE